MNNLAVYARSRYILHKLFCVILLYMLDILIDDRLYSRFITGKLLIYYTFAFMRWKTAHILVWWETAQLIYQGFVTIGQKQILI